MEATIIREVEVKQDPVVLLSSGDLSKSLRRRLRHGKFLWQSFIKTGTTQEMSSGNLHRDHFTYLLSIKPWILCQSGINQRNKINIMDVYIHSTGLIDTYIYIRCNIYYICILYIYI